MKVTYRFFLSLLLFLWACGGDTVPKPRAMLRLEYPEARYETLKKEGYYQFQKNKAAVVSKEKEYALNITYPAMKATLFITYKKIENNLDQLLADAQKLTYEHVIKADAITEQPFIDKTHSVYGMLYEISGNAASQSQFYATDSIKNFLTGSLYFYVRPNYDSVLPAADYLKKDIRKIMETLRWERY